MSACPCCSNASFDICCQPLLSGAKPAETAEALMRSRYTAYVMADIAYLIQSTHPSQRKHYPPASLLKWATSSKWMRLEVIGCTQGTAAYARGFVEFKAYYLDETLQPMIHHEYSTFVKEGGRWYFLEGKIMT